MGKHSRRTSGLNSKTATATAVAVGVSAAIAHPASAAEVVIPNSNISFTVDGLENIPNIATVPGIEQWVPSLASTDTAGVHVNADVATSAQADIPVAAPQEPIGQKIVDAAASKIGSPYSYGAAGPSAFDCSGLTSWSYKQVGINIPRTSYAQVSSGTPVAYNDLQPGDIVAFYTGATHVGIYAGNGMVIHASTYGKPLSEVPMSYMPFHSAVRYT